MPEQFRIYEFRTSNGGNRGPNWKDTLVSILPILGILFVVWILSIGFQQALTGFSEKLILYPIFIISLVLHELSHAYMADFLGDPTPRLTGRLSLNPLKHLDIFGTILFLFCGFGWAKPVQVDANNFRKPDRAMVSVALAGPFCNFLLAIFSLLLFKIVFPFVNDRQILGYLYYICKLSAYVNLMLAVFNLLPVPPLDGSRLVHYLLPKKYKEPYYRFSHEYSFLIFILVFMYAGKFIQPITINLLENLLSLFGFR